MAKANKSQSDNSSEDQQEENIVETPAVPTPVAESVKVREDRKEEITLRYGQCIVAPVNDQNEEILTTIEDWNSLYNAGANQGRFVLKAEKKSS
jgi:hypothetical protein